MAKISKHSGPTYTQPETVGRDFPREVIAKGPEEGESPSVGSNSETSPESTPKQSDKPNQSHLPPAPATESHSRVRQAGADSSAPSMGGSGQRTQPQPSARRTGKTARGRAADTDF